MPMLHSKRSMPLASFPRLQSLRLSVFSHLHPFLHFLGPFHNSNKRRFFFTKAAISSFHHQDSLCLLISRVSPQTMLLQPSPQSAISGFISTANWQWRFMCSVSAGHHSTSSGSSGPCVARSPLMHVQPLYMHSLPAGLITVTACWLESEMV